MKVNGGDRSGRRTQAERTAATRAALINAARDLFAEHGYAGVGTQAIVDGAGVTRGALYHQFGDKRGLFEAVFDAVEEETIGGAARAVLEAGDLDPVETMLLAVDTYMAAIAAPGITRITMIDAPTTCHHTEMLLKMASRWLEKMFTSAANTRMTKKMTKTRSSE